MQNMIARPIEILMVEDNPADIRLTEEGLKEAKVANNLHAVTNGNDALDFLYKRNQFASSPRPDLILLDLNLPGINGHEILSAIKQDANLLLIPVVVLTSSQSEADIIKSYEEHANCFISKPVDFNSFMDIVSMIEDFWFSIVRLPKVKMDF